MKIRRGMPEDHFIKSLIEIDAVREAVESNKGSHPLAIKQVECYIPMQDRLTAKAKDQIAEGRAKRSRVVNEPAETVPSTNNHGASNGKASFQNKEIVRGDQVLLK